MLQQQKRKLFLIIGWTILIQSVVLETETDSNFKKCKNELNHIVPSFNVPSQFTVLEVATKTSLSMISSSRFIFVALLSQSGNQNNIT